MSAAANRWRSNWGSVSTKTTIERRTDSPVDLPIPCGQCCRSLGRLNHLVFPETYTCLVMVSKPGVANSCDLEVGSRRTRNCLATPKSSDSRLPKRSRDCCGQSATDGPARVCQYVKMLNVRRVPRLPVGAGQPRTPLSVATSDSAVCSTTAPISGSVWDKAAHFPFHLGKYAVS